NDQSISREAAGFQCIQDVAHALIEDSRTGFEGGHIAARFRSIRDGRRRQRVALVFTRAGFMKLAMCLEESDVQKVRLLGRLLQEAYGGRRNLSDTCSTRLDNFVIADDLRISRDMLDANQAGAIALRP